MKHFLLGDENSAFCQKSEKWKHIDGLYLRISADTRPLVIYITGAQKLKQNLNSLASKNKFAILDSTLLFQFACARQNVY